MSEQEKLLITAEEAAPLLSVSVKTLEAWRAQKKGPPVVKIGRTVRYPVDKLRAWIKENSA